MGLGLRKDRAAVTPFHSKTVPRILLALASVALVLFCIELPALTGMLDYRTVIGPYHMWWAPNVKDPELLAIHRPHARQTGEARGGDSSSSYQIPLADQTQFRWDVTYDRHGFRNREALQSADIVVIGDSFVEGLTVNEGELATSQLSRLQGKVVANLGQSTSVRCRSWSYSSATDCRFIPAPWCGCFSKATICRMSLPIATTSITLRPIGMRCGPEALPEARTWR